MHKTVSQTRERFTAMFNQTRLYIDKNRIRLGVLTTSTLLPVRVNLMMGNSTKFRLMGIIRGQSDRKHS